MYKYSGEDATLGWYDDDDVATADSAQQTVEIWPNVQVIFKSKSGDVLSSKNLKSISDLQKKVVAIDGYKKHCLRGASNGDECMMPYSPSGMATWTSQTNSDTTSCACSTTYGVACANADPYCSADFSMPGCLAKPSASLPSSVPSEPFTSMCKDGTSTNALTSTCNFGLYQARINTVGSNWDCDTLEATWARTLIPLGLPLNDKDDDADVQEETVEYWGTYTFLPAFFEIKHEIEMANDDLEVLLWGAGGWMIEHYLNQDVAFVMTAFILVFFVLWFQTESAFIAACGIFEIIISYPLGTFVWHVILREPYVTYLNYNALFIILGIGADDIFVLVDAYKQSFLQPAHISGSLETRFAWAYNRAASAMLATSLTTCAAFAACAVSVIWDVAGFGIVASVCIACDYLLVISWLAAAIIVQERYLKNCLPWCTPANMCSKLCAFCSKCCACCKKTSGGAPTAAEDAEDDKPEEDTKPKARAIEEFFGGRFADFIIANSKQILIFWTFMFLLSAVLCGALLRPATENTEFFEKTHFYPVSRDASAEKFGLAEGDTTNYIQATFSFGLDPKDPFDLHKAHAVEAVNGEFDDCKANYKGGFDLADYQSEFSTACSTFNAKLISLGLSESNNYYCWIDEFKTWATAKGYGFPVATASFRTYVAEWKSDSETTTDSYLYAADNYEHSGLGDYGGLTGALYNEDRVYYSFASFNLTWSWEDLQNQKMSFPDMWDVYYDLNKALKAAETASTMTGGVHSTAFYDWMVASKVFLESAFWNAGIALAIAFFVILSMTLNYKLTRIVFTGLFYVLAMVCLLMVVAGWKIGIIEAIGISVATGMAVDYVLHLSHSYNHQPPGPAPERVRGALQEMGISILSGCLPTWIACIALCKFFASLRCVDCIGTRRSHPAHLFFPCRADCCAFMWFKLFGCFVTMVIWSSFFVTMTGTSAALCLFGPESMMDGEVIFPDWVYEKTGLTRHTPAEGAGAITATAETSEL